MKNLINNITGFISTRLSWTGRNSLGLKFTVYFALFGILMGYAAFFMLNFIQTRELIEHTARLLQNRFVESTHTGAADELSELVGRRDTDLSRVISFLQEHHTESQGVKEINIYYSSENREWNEIYLDKDRIFRERKAPAEIHDRLIKSYETGLITFSSLLKDQDIYSVVLNITRPSDRNTYLIQIKAGRDGIISILKYHTGKFAVFAVFLLFSSLILGHLFARKLTKPIIEITRGAEDIAEGKYDHRFNISRRDEIGRLVKSLNLMASGIEKHINEVARRMNAMETMNRIDKAVLSSISREELIDSVVSIVSSMFKSDYLILSLRDYNRKGFEIVSIYHDSGKDIPKEYSFIEDAELGDEFVASVDRFSQTDRLSHNQIPETLREHIHIEIGTFLNMPIFISEEYLGSLAIIRKESRLFTPLEVDTIKMISDQVGVAIQNVKQFEEKEQILLGIMLALSRAIDAKSQWTLGHSERVTRLADETGKAMNLPEEELNGLRAAALLHDIGKIAVPESILDKKSKLTEEEFESIKQHPETGAAIVTDIPSYEKIRDAILSHHERFDGSGYPSGNAGREIPLSGRILAIADVYDALTADRPYRKGIAPEEAAAFIKKNSGTMFDPEVAEAFLKAIDTEHQADAE